MQINKKIEKLIKKNTFIRKIARKIYFLKCNFQYKRITNKITIDDNLIIFASFNGRSYCDSPKSLYQYMINNIEKFEKYNFVWAFNDTEKYSFLKKNPNTQIIDIKSKDFLKILGKAKYWIFNYKIQDYIFPKKDQIFVQCWHGTPLKRLGCDIQNSDNAMNSISEIRKRYHIEAKKFSYFISPSKFATEKFISTWELDKINKKNIIIEEGYPRNDFLINYTSEDIKIIKEKLNLNNNHKKIILYAPTYRDNQHSTDIGYIYDTKVNFDKLQKELADEYIILFRAHWLVTQEFDFKKYENFIINVSDYDDINELYVISDLLITDYSSVFFDFANLKKPILFYMYDLEDYRDKIRGFYLDIKELPGKILKTEEELIEQIVYKTSNFKYDKKYRKFNDKYNYLDDGQASKRVIEKIFQ